MSTDATEMELESVAPEESEVNTSIDAEVKEEEPEEVVDLTADMDDEMDDDIKEEEEEQTEVEPVIFCFTFTGFPVVLKCIKLWLS